MNKNIKKYLTIVAIVLIIAGLLVYFLSGDKQEIVKLDTIIVAKGDIVTSVTATGTIEPIKLVEVGTQVSGVISKIYVDFNSAVKKGDVLAELDKDLLRSELETAQANLMSRQVELNNQKRNFDRQKTLWEKQAISKADWESAETTYKTSELAVTSSKAAALKAQTNLGYATILSSIDGVVISRAVEEGQTVASSFNTPTLFTIANDLTKMRVIANVDEADIGNVREGQRVNFTVDAYPNDEFEGSVVQVRLEATTTSNVVTYEVVIDAPNANLKLKPGLTASVAIYTTEEREVLRIPSKALRFNPLPEQIDKLEQIAFDIPAQPMPKDDKNKTVWVKNGNNVSPRTITVGESDGANVKVTGGISEGEELVTAISEKQTVNSSKNNASEEEKSPFMPQRPGGTKKR